MTRDFSDHFHTYRQSHKSPDSHGTPVGIVDGPPEAPRGRARARPPARLFDARSGRIGIKLALWQKTAVAVSKRWDERWFGARIVRSP